MPRVTTSIEIEGTSYTVTGSAYFAGPYAECEGGEIEECDPDPASDDVREMIEEHIVDAAYEAHQESQQESCDDYEDDDYNDYQDEHDARCVSRGGDYWYDPESGEPRCG